MSMPASSEFITLCRSQVSLLTQAMGASLGVVYLSERLVDGKEGETQQDNPLVPVVVEPDTSAIANEDEGWMRLSDRRDGDFPSLPLPSDDSNSIALPVRETLNDEAIGEPFLPPEVETHCDTSGLNPHQIVLPLVHDGMAMGLLVVARHDRPWNDPEQSQVRRIARTLAIACMLDQRSEWFEHHYRQQQQRQAQQHDLLDNLLHQIRNPLTALRTFGKLLLRRVQPDDANHNIATNLVRESDRLQELLQQFDEALDDGEDALDAALPESDAPHHPTPLLPASSMTLAPCDLEELLAPLVASARAIASDRQLTLHADIPAELPPARANAKALREVTSNLIDNAIKYTPEGGRVSVQVTRQPHDDQTDRMAIAISDTGVGIPSDDLDRVFERRYRGVQAQGDIPGTGLGLAIARDLVWQMQGDIRVCSPAQPLHSLADIFPSDRGTTFIVELPAVR